MALTPDSKRALLEAIDAIVKESGDDPRYTKLVDELKSVDSLLGDTDDSAPSAPTRDSADDQYSFETAQKRHTERTAANHAAMESTGTDGGEGK